jgi:transporter family protein
MKASIWFAVMAGVAWGVGGYFEKAGLRAVGMPPIVGITLRTLVALVVLGLVSIPFWKGLSPAAQPSAWWMILLGGGLVAGSLGMWSFYSALSRSENLGITLALAFACSPLAGTLLGLLRGDQPWNGKIALGIAAIVAGTIFLQLGRAAHPH